MDAFDENNLWANIKEGAIEVSGENLSVEKLDLDEGLLVVRGIIRSFSYIDKKPFEKNPIIKIENLSINKPIKVAKISIKSTKKAISKETILTKVLNIDAFTDCFAPLFSLNLTA